MAYPSRQDYREALQWPDVALPDVELKSAKTVVDPLGMPRAYSGQNATVFTLQNGTTRWAVKCFTHETADQQRRYAAISDALRQVALPFTVPFEYQLRGIHIRSAYYPILKMEWVDGEGLKPYIERNLHKPNALRQTAVACLTMGQALRSAGIAHGDLQHGNILVCGSTLKLVDYDGMFVPAIAALGSSEVGHRDYQHPRRTADIFDGDIDTFSVWVIVLSLLALSERPSLWANTGARTEGLLFTKQDFEQPDASPTLLELMTPAVPTCSCLRCSSSWFSTTT